MPHKPGDEEREERITMEIVVYTYNAEEQAMGWYYYLERTLQFPFAARSITQQARSPLQPGDEVEVVGMAPVEECHHDMLVTILWNAYELDIPLSELQGIDVDEKTQQAIEDWHYWVDQGYEL